MRSFEDKGRNADRRVREVSVRREKRRLRGERWEKGSDQ